MKKRYILLFALLGILILLFSPINTAICTYQNFDNQFYVSTQMNEHYEDVSWCKPNGALGCVAEYWEDDAGCELNGDEVAIYYYNESVLLDGESNVYHHVHENLIHSYLYKEQQHQGKNTLFKSTINMRNVPPYLMCVRHGNKVVCVGGENIDKIKQYSQSVVFNPQ